ncbi:MAG: peptide chain release factor 1 [Fibrobacterota bacterium]
MLPDLDKKEERFRELEQALMAPDAAKDVNRLRQISIEHNELKKIVDVIAQYRRVHRDLEDNQALVKEGADKELVDLARAEIPELEARFEALSAELRLLLVPRDPLDVKNALVEIRAGTGGEEAALFAGDLYRMYMRYAETRHWKIDVMTTSPADMGGIKEIVFLVEGDGVYGDLRYENGVHRVQRVPKTESQGRIHTSAASVVVMPEADDIEVVINPAEIRVDVFRSSGPGGQNVNKTDSAVRMTHIPSGLVVTCQDEKSQLKNKAKALKVLKSRLMDQEIEKHEKAISAERKRAVGTGDRSAKIRTYNFPQNRVTEHRLTDDAKNYPLERVVEGDLNAIIEALKKESINDKLRAGA